MPSSEVETLLARKSDADSMLCRMREKSQHYFFSLFKVSSRSKIGLLYFFTQKIIFPGAALNLKLVDESMRSWIDSISFSMASLPP